MQIAEAGHSERNSSLRLDVLRYFASFDDAIALVRKELRRGLGEKNQPANPRRTRDLLELLHDDPAEPSPAAISGDHDRSH